MKKRYIVIPAALALLCGICIGSRDFAPEGFNKSDIIKKSRDFINCANKRDFDSCYSSFNKIMRDSMSEAKFESILNSVLDGLGEFVSFKDTNIYSTKSLGIDYAKCVVKCTHENGTATFTILFDHNMQIGGLFIK